MKLRQTLLGTEKIFTTSINFYLSKNMIYYMYIKIVNERNINFY